MPQYLIFKFKKNQSIKFLKLTPPHASHEAVLFSVNPG